jgi:hypothetical protein
LVVFFSRRRFHRPQQVEKNCRVSFEGGAFFSLDNIRSKQMCIRKTLMFAHVLPTYVGTDQESDSQKVLINFNHSK